VNKNKIINYKDLNFLKTSFQTTVKVVKITKKISNERIYWIVADQLARVSTQMGVNIAEGFGRYKGKEYQKFIRISLGSANEVEY
jgi:four helix bundle protein